MMYMVYLYAMQTINTFHKYINSETIVPVAVTIIPEITNARCAVGKHNGKWFVWEVLTGRPVVQLSDTKKKAVSLAIDQMSRNSHLVEKAIAMFPHLNK